jgi:hypothetical protein
MICPVCGEPARMVQRDTAHGQTATTYYHARTNHIVGRLPARPVEPAGKI